MSRVLGERDEAAVRASGFVPMTTLWWAEGEQLLCRLAIRHRLTPVLERAGSASAAPSSALSCAFRG